MHYVMIILRKRVSYRVGFWTNQRKILKINNITITPSSLLIITFLEQLSMCRARRNQEKNTYHSFEIKRALNVLIFENVSFSLMEEAAKELTRLKRNKKRHNKYISKHIRQCVTTTTENRR